MPTEADTCRTYVVPKLHAAGWEDDFIAEQRVIAPGRIVPLGRKHTRQESRRPDYILSLRRNYPIAVVEAKAGYKQPGDGLQQAMNYADMLGVKFAYASNGKGIVEHDFTTGQERTLAAFGTVHSALFEGRKHLYKLAGRLAAGPNQQARQGQAQ